MATKLPNAESAYQHLLKQLEQGIGQSPGMLVGVHSGGAWIAERLAKDLNSGRDEADALGLGFLSSAFHRDDYAKRGLPGQMKSTELPISIDGLNVVLVDDILFTGRTVRAVLNELFDYGRPSKVSLAVLVDRGGRELPIEAAYSGASFEPQENQNLRLEQDENKEFILRIV
jgi:pyrimidine operon attenuation protein/uracil phosphoribosyltransferase